MQSEPDAHETAETTPKGASWVVGEAPAVAIWPSPIATHRELEGHDTPSSTLMDESDGIPLPPHPTMVQEPPRTTTYSVAVLGLSTPLTAAPATMHCVVVGQDTLVREPPLVLFEVPAPDSDQLVPPFVVHAT
jgi:hypothetical protein